MKNNKSLQIPTRDKAQIAKMKNEKNVIVRNGMETSKAIPFDTVEYGGRMLIRIQPGTNKVGNYINRASLDLYSIKRFNNSLLDLYFVFEAEPMGV